MSSSLSCLTLLLLCCACLGAESPSHRRQKRGIMKMMMHVMWDPVRLIRYWYAYDVTKEIAKSWRKIIPTILLLPFSPHPSFAKYVNPPMKDTNKGSSELQDYVFHKVPYDLSQQQQVVSSSSSNLDPVQPLSYQHHSDGVRYTSLPDLSHASPESLKDAQHFLLRPLNQEFLTSNDFGQSSERKEEQFFNKLPIPYKISIPGPNGNLLLKGIPVPLSTSETRFRNSMKGERDHSQPSSSENSENVLTHPHFRVRPKNYFNAHPESISYFNRGQNQTPDPQEIHIVLHPIPVSDPDRFQKAAGVNGYQFVPFHPNTSDLKNGFFPFGFPPKRGPPLEDAPPYPEQASSTNDSEVQDSDPKDQDGPSVDLKDLKDHNISSSEMYDARPTSRVVWMLSRDTVKPKPKTSDHRSEESVVRVNSVHRTYEDGHGNRKRFNESSESPNRHNLNKLDIDMVQLKEDLKHGTPVLIPFNKKVLYPAKSKCRDRHTDSKESTTFYPIESENSRLANHRKEPIVLNLSTERFEDRNSTQRLLLFLTKKQSSHAPE